MKVLVTGSDGFIGRYVVKELLQHGHTVVQYDYVNGDNVLTPNYEDCDVIVHLAALIDIKESFDDPERYYLVNTIGTGMLPRDKRIIFASSAAVYGESSPYAESKRMAEYLLPENSLIFRIFNPFGSGENHRNESHLIPRLMSGEKIEVFQKGKQVRNFIEVNDVARAFRMAVESDVVGTFDLCNDYPLTVKEVVDLMKVKVKYKGSARDSGDSDYLHGDNEPLRTALDWSPEIDVRKSLANWRNWK